MFSQLKEFLHSALNTASDRAKNPVFGAFFFSWCAFNWKSLLFLFFSKTPIIERIDYISAASDWKTALFYPLASAAFLCLVLPWVNNVIHSVQSRPNLNSDAISDKRKAKSLQSSIYLKRLEAERDITYEKVRTDAEKEIQTMRETITESKDRMGILTAEITAKDEELNRITTQLFEASSRLLDSEEKISKLIDSYNQLNVQYESEKNQFSEYRSKYTIENNVLSRGLVGFGELDGLSSKIIPAKKR